MQKNNNSDFIIRMDSRMLGCLAPRSVILSRLQAFQDLLSRRVSEKTTVVKNNRAEVLMPGEAETSVNVLAEEWNWDRKTVRRFLTELNECGLIRTRRLMYASVSSFPTVTDNKVHEEDSPPEPMFPEEDLD